MEGTWRRTFRSSARPHQRSSTASPRDDLAVRIDAMLALPRPRRYITPELALATILLCFVRTAAHAGVQRMPKKEEKLRAMGLLPSCPGLGMDDRFVAYEKILADALPTTARTGTGPRVTASTGARRSSGTSSAVTTATGEWDDVTSLSDQTSWHELAESLYVDADFLRGGRRTPEGEAPADLLRPAGHRQDLHCAELIEHSHLQEEQREIVQFHPSYSYEDFVRATGRS